MSSSFALFFKFVFVKLFLILCGFCFLQTLLAEVDVGFMEVMLMFISFDGFPVLMCQFIVFVFLFEFLPVRFGMYFFLWFSSSANVHLLFLLT